MTVALHSGRFFPLCLAAALMACGGSTPPPETQDIPDPEPVAEPVVEEPKEEEPPPPPPRKTAKEMITSGGAFQLVLADSDLMTAKTTECEKKSKGDEAKQTDCMAKATELAATDGIRFEQDDAEAWWWVSFSGASGKEVVHNRIQFVIASDAETTITLTPQGKDKGKKPWKKLPTEMVIEAPDENTLVLQDPTRGKLVYRKAP